MSILSGIASIFTIIYFAIHSKDNNYTYYLILNTIYLLNYLNIFAIIIRNVATSRTCSIQKIKQQFVKVMIYSKYTFPIFVSINFILFSLYFLLFYANYTSHQYTVSFLPLLFTSLITMLMYHNRNQRTSVKGRKVLNIMIYVVFFMLSVTNIVIFHAMTSLNYPSYFCMMLNWLIFLRQAKKLTKKMTRNNNIFCQIIYVMIISQTSTILCILSFFQKTYLELFMVIAYISAIVIQHKCKSKDEIKLIEKIVKEVEKKEMMERLRQMQETIMRTTKNVTQQCIICLQDGQMIELQCSHHFHYLCIYEWMIIRNLCPLCKKQITFKIDLEEIQSTTGTNHASQLREQLMQL